MASCLALSRDAKDGLRRELEDFAILLRTSRNVCLADFCSVTSLPKTETPTFRPS